MKLMKKILAISLVLIMALSAIGCHKKDEIAVTVNGFDYTSAYYMCALINAYNDGTSQVQAALGDKANADIDIFKQNIGGKKFEEWVKNRAIEILKEVGTYQKLCKDAKVELSDDLMTQAQNTAYYMWAYYGYGQIYEPNGVSWNTFLQFTVDSFYKEAYFLHLYGEKGKNEIPTADVEAKLYKDFLIADMLEVTFQSETDKQKEEIKAKLDGYVKDLTEGKKTFEEVYNDYNKVEDKEDKEESDKDKTETDKTEDDKTETPDADENHDHDHDGDGEPDHEDDKKLEPKDKYAQILGAKDTGYDNDRFDEISKMKAGEVKLITKDNKAGYILVVKCEMKDDPYYLENLGNTVRHLLKDTDFEKLMADQIKAAKVEISDFAVDRFEVDEIVFPEY